MFRRFLKQLDDQINLKLLSKIVLVLLIVYLLKMTLPLVGELVIHAEKHHNTVFYGLFDCLYRSSVNRMDAEKGNQ